MLRVCGIKYIVPNKVEKATATIMLVDKKGAAVELVTIFV